MRIDMQYIKAVHRAMKQAKEHGETYIVFGIKRRWWFGWDYYWGTHEFYLDCLNNYNTPVIKLMTVLSNGRVAQ